MDLLTYALLSKKIENITPKVPIDVEFSVNSNGELIYKVEMQESSSSNGGES